MWDAAASGGDASWTSDRRVGRENHVGTPLSVQNKPTLAEEDVTVSIQTKNLPNALLERSPADMYNSTLNELDFTPTLFNPRRTTRCRVDSFVMLFVVLVAFMGSFFALLMPIFSYESPTAVVKVDCLNVWGTTSLGFRQHYSIHDLFCTNFSTKSDSYAALYIMTVFVVIVGFCFTLVPIICGRTLLCSYFVPSLLILSWLFVTGALIMVVLMYRNKLCHNTSLKELGFHLGPAFGAAVALFSFLSVALIVVVALAVKYWHKY